MAKIASDIGISGSCLRIWIARADVDKGRKDGMTTSEREELVQFRRESRVRAWRRRSWEWPRPSSQLRTAIG